MSLIPHRLARGFAALLLATGFAMLSPSLPGRDESVMAQNASANPHAQQKGDNRSQTAVLATDGVPFGLDENSNPSALLARLRSLVRNINGLLRSADPHMDGVRDFVIASADCEINCDALQAAANVFLETWIAPAPFDDYLYDSPTIEDLIARYEALMDPDLEVADEDAAAWEAEVAALESVFAEPEVATYLEALVASSQQALHMALEAASSPSRDYTDEEWEVVMAWANEVLGVGDEIGTIDDLVAMLE